jgi:hypothetical protein
LTYTLARILAVPWPQAGRKRFSQFAEREMIVATIKSDAARARAEASFKKEERAKEGAKAMMEYQANGRMIRERMERLRALRLAKEAKEAADKKAVGS